MHLDNTSAAAASCKRIYTSGRVDRKEFSAVPTGGKDIWDGWRRACEKSGNFTHHTVRVLQRCTAEEDTTVTHRIFPGDSGRGSGCLNNAVAFALALVFRVSQLHRGAGRALSCAMLMTSCHKWSRTSGSLCFCAFNRFCSRVSSILWSWWRR